MQFPTSPIVTAVEKQETKLRKGKENEQENHYSDIVQ